YCEEHQRTENKRYERYYRKYKPSKRYGHKWEKISDRSSKAHPLCEMCYKEGRTVFADVVHHTKPIAEGGASDESNLMSVCFHHHELIHRKRGDR
ncbi:MAG: HNH endonuclease signature motif containing protein, partial [Acutalibacteraceae bacterium]|nr:HNH endonuclease signature motif containing protein [Acutalibacteraceae bacterium]